MIVVPNFGIISMNFLGEVDYDISLTIFSVLPNGPCTEQICFQEIKKSRLQLFLEKVSPLSLIMYRMPGDLLLLVKCTLPSSPLLCFSLHYA